MAAGSKPKGRRKPAARSRVTNGMALFLGNVDERSAPARRFADILAEIVSDLGGSDTLSEGERQIARRAAMISIACEQIEGKAIEEGRLDNDALETFGRLSDRLGRCFQRLGLRRRAKDVTPNLKDYLARKAT